MSAEEYRRTWRPKLTSEDDLQSWVLDYAERNGWLTFHLPNWLYRVAFLAMKRQRRGDRKWSTKGFPDTVCLRGPHKDQPARLLFLELKSADGRLKPEQRSWLGWLAMIPGVESGVYRPADQDRLEELLR